MSRYIVRWCEWVQMWSVLDTVERTTYCDCRTEVIAHRWADKLNSNPSK